MRLLVLLYRMKNLICIVCIIGLPLSWSLSHQSQATYTSAVLQVAYDGTFFHGWSAGNDNKEKSIDSFQETSHNTFRQGRSRRNRLRPSIKQGEIRSVQGVLKGCLSKLFGDAPPDHVIVEGCSRTDKGVHAKGMTALIYCMIEGKGIQSINGKRKPHPVSPSDDNFKELPFNSDIEMLIRKLNRMLPPDVRILNASPMPSYQFNGLPFHPSLATTGKTYRYTISVGDICDPIRSHYVWHVGNTFDIERANICADVLKGSHDFSGFRGAFRGSERGRSQDTICNIFDISISEDIWADSSSICKTYQIEITGDRFLYKMVRFIVGFIVQFSQNDGIEIQGIMDALDNQECSFPRVCAPAHGLRLIKVHYPSSIDFQWIVGMDNS